MGPPYYERSTARQRGEHRQLGPSIFSEVADVLKDFAAIAQVETDQVETEEAERQLEDLVDYVRLAAVSLVQDAINQRESQS